MEHEHNRSAAYLILWIVGILTYAAAYALGAMVLDAFFPTAAPVWYWFPVLFGFGAMGAVVFVMAAFFYDYERGR